MRTSEFTTCVLDELLLGVLKSPTVISPAESRGKGKVYGMKA